MTNDEAGSTHQSAKEREARERTSEKHLDKKGHPTSAEQRDAANHTKTTVTQNPEPSPHKIKKAMDKE